VVAGRFHKHLLRAPREARNAIAYVLNNARHHGAWIPADRPDPRSSGRFFDGWLDFAAQHFPGLFLPVAAARTWLLTVGWRCHGSIPVGKGPGQLTPLTLLPLTKRRPLRFVPSVAFGLNPRGPKATEGMKRSPLRPGQSPRFLGSVLGAGS
jgi:hypothetical protein